MSKLGINSHGLAESFSKMGASNCSIFEQIGTLKHRAFVAHEVRIVFGKLEAFWFILAENQSRQSWKVVASPKNLSLQLTAFRWSFGASR